MSADPFKTLRDRQLEYQAEPVVLVDPATGEAGAIRLSGSSVDLRGLAANKPLATAVDVGVTYWSVDTGEIEVSDGTDWQPV